MGKRFGLATKFNLLTISLILVTALGIALYQTHSEKVSRHRDLLEHGMSLTAMIAQNSEYGLYAEHLESLTQVVDSAFADPGVVYVAIHGADKQLLLSKTRDATMKLAPPSHGSRFDEATGSRYGTFRTAGAECIDIWMPVEGRSHGAFDDLFLEGDEEPHQQLGYVQLGLTLETLRARVRESLVSVLLLTAVVVVIGAGLTLATTRKITAPIQEFERMANEIAEGEGDLTRVFSADSEDEVGKLAAGFNRFVAKLGEMVRRARGVSADLTDAMGKIRASSKGVKDGAVRQCQELEESYGGVRSIEEAATGVAQSTSSLVGSVEESSTAAMELGSTGQEIASQMDSLFGIVEQVSDSIREMSVTAQQIADNAEALSSSTVSTASSIHQLDGSIRTIQENAERTNRLSHEAAEDAEQGKVAVDETIEGIGAIREMVDRASATIQELGEQANDIDRILSVINDVTDQTGLLALNAAILAAQAGNHGKGFAVVAAEIGDLAERAALSTGEIAAIIEKLQVKSREAVTAMREGSERVHREVARSKTAGAALDKIRASTLKATEEVECIVQATQEQSRGSQQITESINQVASMLDSIATAIQEQTAGIQELAGASEAMKEIAYQVNLSTGEQAEGTHQISVHMENIRQMIERIDEATREQTHRCRQVVEAVSAIRGISQDNVGRTTEMDEVLEILFAQTKTLEQEVGAFTV